MLYFEIFFGAFANKNRYVNVKLCIITYLQGRNFAKIIGGAHNLLN